VREVAGEVSATGDASDWAIRDPATGIVVNCSGGRWEMSVPYWARGEAAVGVAERLHAFAGIICELTGLEAYDPQLEQGVASSRWAAQHGIGEVVM
jgi:hypothetical protein